MNKIDLNYIAVDLRNEMFERSLETSINRNGKMWLEVSRTRMDSITKCAEEKCLLISLKLIGRQSYKDKNYDTLDILKEYGNPKEDTQYLIDGSYKILSDTLVLEYIQANDNDTLEMRDIYKIQ